jgi:hypothetical protein
MLDAFTSVGIATFDVTLTDLAGTKTGFQSGQSVAELRRTMSNRLQAAARSQQNFILRPRKSGWTQLVQLDDLNEQAAARIAPHAFMVLCTSPTNFQAWVAIEDPPQDFARRLRKGAGADPTASGATRVSGSVNFKTKYAPAFPLVTITHINADNVVSAAALEQAGFVAPAEQPPARVSSRSSQSYRGRRRWPSYTRCLQHAPLAHRGDRPDVSKADFTWAMTAIDWGWSVEETAKRLMEESSKARENGEGYALATAQNAAAAVQRRHNLKPPPEPR